MAWMIPKTIKPLCILADANIIIELHNLGIWNQFTRQCQVATTAYIIKQEAIYFKSVHGHTGIDLSKYLAEGSVIELSADAMDLAAIYDKFESTFLETIDYGEIEAIALINANKTGDALFCSGDGLAYQALAMIGKASLGISLERVFEKAGFKGSIHRLRHEYCEKFFVKHTGIGRQNFISNFGLKPEIKY